MKLALQYLDGENPAPVEINATYPFAYGDTVANLKAAAAGEHEESEVDYPAFAKIAKEEGFDEIAERFLLIADVGRKSIVRGKYLKLLENIENGTVFKKDGKVFWKCLNCGYVHEGDAAPIECPACKHSQAYFQLLDDCF